MKQVGGLRLGKMYTRMTMIGIILIVALAGCSFGKKPPEKVYDHLESAAKQEQDFAKDQQKMVKKEKKEQDLYDKAIKLDMKKFDEMTSLSKQAAKMADERKNLLDDEKESLDASYEEFDKVKPIIKDLDDADMKKKANQVAEKMDKRHKAFGKLYDAYESSTSLDKKLYQMLQDKKLKPEALQKQIDQVNNKYKTVNKAKEEFNTDTDQYNKAKKAFYKAADLNVTFEDKD